MTHVALLWHMHQPYYEDLATREHILPWVRLHALKDYYGMVALLREFPDVRMTFNLVPSLLVQLEAFAADRARDRFLELSLKPADALTPEEVDFVLANFFHAQRQHMIDLYPRYGELLARRGGTAASAADRRAAAARFTADDLRDLQVWHKLAWIDPLYLDHDPRVRALVAKGRGFTEDDKATAAHSRAGTAEQSDPRIPRRRGARTDRGLGLAVLSPDPAAAVRHGRLPADPSRVADAAASGSGVPETRRYSSNAPPPITSGCSAAGRSGSGRRRGRCRTRWCRSSPPPDSGGWRPTS